MIYTAGSYYNAVSYAFNKLVNCKQTGAKIYLLSPSSYAITLPVLLLSYHTAVHICT